MILESDKFKIIECAKRYNVGTVILFGSSLKEESARDIDIGIKGISPELFFRFYGDLIFSLSKPVDIIDLDSDSLFNRIVEEEGIKIYG